MCLKASRKLSVLRRVKNLQRSTLDILYKTTVHSVIDFGLFIYYKSLNQTDINKINKIQYTAAKFVTSTLLYTSTKSLECELGWESIKERADFLGLTLFHKIHCNNTRSLIKECMPLYNSRHEQPQSLFTYTHFPFKGVNFANSYFPYFTRKWNNKSLKKKNVDDFKIELKALVKPKRYKFYSKGAK